MADQSIATVLVVVAEILTFEERVCESTQVADGWISPHYSTWGLSSYLWHIVDSFLPRLNDMVRPRLPIRYAVFLESKKYVTLRHSTLHVTAEADHCVVCLTAFSYTLRL